MIALNMNVETSTSKPLTSAVQDNSASRLIKAISRFNIENVEAELDE